MEIGKPPAIDSLLPRAAARNAGELENGAAVVKAVAEADIRPLDSGAAMQILLTEVQSALEALPALTPPVPDSPPVPGSPLALLDPPQTARALVNAFLQALPQDDVSPQSWLTSLEHLQSAFQSAMDRAVQIVAAWRQVPPPVVEAAAEVRTEALSLISEETSLALLVRPEMSSLIRPVERFRRRRRAARRRLTDPDFVSQGWDPEAPAPHE
jgi:hypothetical protein